MPNLVKRFGTISIFLFLVTACQPTAISVTPLTVSPTGTHPLITETTGFTATTVSPTETITPVPTAQDSTVSRLRFTDSGQALGEGGCTDVSLGDLDGDGNLDAMVSCQGLAQVWLNDGQGGFSSNEQELAIPSGWHMGLDLGDLDGDGDLDAFIVVTYGAGRVLLNMGGAQGGAAGSFLDSGQQLSASSGIGFDLDLGDLDSDGDLDAYVGYERANLVWINDGQGVFQDSGQRLGAAITAGVGLADLDADGDLDALAGGWDEPARVWLNDGQGIFTDSGHNLTDAAVHIHGLDLGDVDNDGDLDVFLAIASGHPNQAWLNNGQGIFTDSGQQLRGSLAHAVALGDLDQDGDLDAFLANASATGEYPNTIWLNDGHGNYSDSGLRLGYEVSYSVDLGDLDGDGDLDAFVANNRSPNRVWLNNLYQHTPIGGAVLSAYTAGQIVRLYTLEGHRDYVNDLAFSADGRYLVSSSLDRTINVWNVANGQVEHTFELNYASFNGIAISPDGRWLASADAIWDVVSGEQVYTLEQRRYSPGPVAFSPDGIFLAVALERQPIKLWEVANGQVGRTFERWVDEVTFSLAYSPDGSLLAVGTHGGIVRLWDVANGQVAGTLEHGDNEANDIHDVAFSPDGRLLASGSTDYTACLWDVASGELVDTLYHGNGLYGLAFSPDGRLLATAGCDRTVKLWDVASGELLTTLRHADEVMTVAFSPDGRLLASGAYDQRIYVWGVNR